MASIPEYLLQGTSNFNTWKARVIKILKEHDLDSFVTIVIEEPNTIARRTNYKNNQLKAKRIIYDSVKDNLMSLFTPLKTKKEYFDTLTNLIEKTAPTQNRDLKNKLRNMKMERSETIASLFTNISLVKDQLPSISVETDEDNLLQTAIDEIPASWETFLAAVNGRE